MSISRRQFIRTAGVAGAAAVGLSAEQASASQPIAVSDDTVGVLVDLPKCIGCRRCEFACQDAAGFDPPPLETYEDKTVMSEHRRPSPDCYTTINEFPNPPDPTRPVYTKSNCLHCNYPACLSACLVGAFSKRKDGAVIYDPWKCMGCRYCMVACPFQIPTYDYDEPLTPQVRKCNLCSHKIPDLDEDPTTEKDWQIPSCVKICPEEVMIYGKRRDLLARARQKIQQQPDLYVDHIYGEHEVGGTSWLYLSSEPFEDIQYLKLAGQAPPLLTETIQHAIFKNFVPPVAWFGLLGAIMWLGRPGAESGMEESQDSG